jgi:hypothetical protein
MTTRGCARFTRLTPGYFPFTPPACEKRSPGVNDYQGLRSFPLVQPLVSPEGCWEISPGLSEAIPGVCLSPLSHPGGVRGQFGQLRVANDLESQYSLPRACSSCDSAELPAGARRRLWSRRAGSKAGCALRRGRRHRYGFRMHRSCNGRHRYSPQRYVHQWRCLNPPARTE